MTIYPELELLQTIAPLVQRSANGGYVILLDSELRGHIYSHVVTAEGCVKMAMKTLEALQSQSTQNKDLITASIIGAALKTLRVEIARMMLTMGAEAVGKQQ